MRDRGGVILNMGGDQAEQGMAGDALSAGLSFEEDAKALASLREQSSPLVLILVKAWEPPMADLADFIDEASQLASCLVLLRPMPGASVTREQLEDWRHFLARRPAEPALSALTASSRDGAAS